MNQIIGGVDTHKSSPIAVAIDTQGTRLGGLTIPRTSQGYGDPERWAQAPGPVKAFGIEGTGSYGAGLSRGPQAKGHTVIEVRRPNRQLRHLRG